MCSCSSRRGKRCGSLTVSHSSVSNPPALKPSKQPPFLQQKPACLLALSLRTSTLYPQLACQRGRPCPSAFHIMLCWYVLSEVISLLFLLSLLVNSAFTSFLLFCWGLRRIHVFNLPCPIEAKVAHLCSTFSAQFCSFNKTSR